MQALKTNMIAMRSEASQIPWIAGTSTLNLDPFLPPLLTVTFDQTTIKHSLYMQKVH